MKHKDPRLGKIWKAPTEICSNMWAIDLPTFVVPQCFNWIFLPVAMHYTRQDSADINTMLLLFFFLFSTVPQIKDQGGILAGSLGARLPRNLQTHTKFCQHFTLFWRKLDLKVCISCQIKKFFLSHTTCRKYFLSQEETSWHCTLLISTGRNLLS